MPSYAYHCREEGCDYVEDVLVRVADRNEPHGQCPKHPDSPCTRDEIESAPPVVDLTGRASGTRRFGLTTENGQHFNVGRHRR